MATAHRLDGDASLAQDRDVASHGAIGHLETAGQLIGREARPRLEEVQHSQRLGSRADGRAFHNDMVSGRGSSGMTSTLRVMDVILIAGLWLPASIWDDVAAELQRHGHRPIPVALPGVDDRSTGASLDDQLAAGLDAVDHAHRPLVVGHSAASTLAWLIADRRPGALAGVVMVGGFPATNGSPYADLFETVDGTMPFPGWEPFDGPDSADLDDEARTRIERVAVSVPEGVSKAEVVLTDEARFEVPVVLVCPEYSPQEANEWLDAGQIPELERVAHLSFVDIDSGHWPMITQSAELARIINHVAEAV
jgi:pimeloyl-ACP methyl ester carboxylesterase